MNLRILIVDDESLARDRLRRLLGKHSDIEIVGEAGNGIEAAELIKATKCDLIFLDVQMPGLDGFELLQKIEVTAAVVFVTAFDQYAIRAFEQRALDYLLKPVTEERLSETLARIREKTTALDLPRALLDLLGKNENKTGVQRIVIREGGRTVFVPVDSIDWIESASNYVILHVGKENHILRETMSGMETQLPESRFLRLSRSAIVNLVRIVELRSVSDAENVAVLSGGEKIRMTRSMKEVETMMRKLPPD